MKVSVAADPLIAMRKMQLERPDVVLLDLELPRMNGLAFLRKLMQEDPLPVVVCSGLTAAGTEESLTALFEGAVAVVEKAKLGVRGFLHDAAPGLIETVRGAAAARPLPPRCRPGASPNPAHAAAPALRRTTDKVIAVGASTGGTEALRQLLEGAPVDAPGFVIVQHMPEGFTRAFAARLDQICNIEVKEAAPEDRVLRGRALIAPGNHHLKVRRDGGHYAVDVVKGPPVSGHRPSVDVLFESVAASAGSNAVGVILTGMGADGADGLLAMRQAGASTLAQDEASCVVFGMPKAALARGAVEQVLPLHRIGAAALERAAGVRPSPPGRRASER